MDLTDQQLIETYIGSIPPENRDKLDKELDFESNGVPIHLGAIARTIDSWEGDVSDVLGLTKSDVANIKAEYQGQLNLQVRAALHKWQEKKGVFATYHSLIVSFVKIGKTSYAEAVCKVLGANFGTRACATATQPSATTGKVATVVPDDHGSSVNSFLPMNSDLEVKSLMKQLEREFLNLQRQLLSELQQSMVNVDVVQNELFLLPLSIQEEHYYFVKQAITELKNVGNLQELFLHMNLYWNFFEYNLLEYVVSYNGSSELNQKMEQYSEKMENFKQKTTVAQFMRFWPGNHEIPPHFSTVNVTLEINCDKCTLAELDEFRKKLCRRARLLEFALITFNMKGGSVIVTFITSCQLVSTLVLVCHHDPQILTSHHVIALSIDGEFVEDFEVEKLPTAARYGDVKTVETLLQFDVDPNTLDEFGNTSIMWASQEGHIEIVKVLIAHKVDINFQHHYEGWSALMIASQLGHTHIVELLLSNQVQVNATLKDGVTSLHLASAYGHLDVVKALLTHNDVDVNMAREDGSTPLIMASAYGHTDVVQVLLNHHANVNIARKDGYTPLIWASEEGYMDIAQLLLSHNAEVDVKGGKGGRTALMMACLFNHLEIVQLLLQFDTDVNAVSEDGLTALIIASKYGHSRIVKALLEAKADPNVAEKKSGWVPLFFAAQGGHIGITEMLIQHGTDVDTQDKMGSTAYEIACTYNHEEVGELLKTHSQLWEQTTFDTEDERELYAKYLHTTFILKGWTTCYD